MALIDTSHHEDGANGRKDVQHESFVLIFCFGAYLGQVLHHFLVSLDLKHQVVQPELHVAGRRVTARASSIRELCGGQILGQACEQLSLARKSLLNGFDGLLLRGRHPMLLLIKCNFYCSFDMIINLTSVFSFDLIKIPLSFGDSD